MRFLLAALLFLATGAYADTITGNLGGQGNITFNPPAPGSMSGHLYGNGDFYVAGVTPFDITNPVDGQCMVYSASLAAWVNSSCGGGGGGTVTSVGLTAPSWLSVAGSPVTTSGVLSITAATGQTANRFVATPDGTTGAVGLRAIVAADLPSSITSNTSGNAATATALAANPTDCSANQYTTAIAASGNLTCAQVSASQLSDGVTGTGALVLANNAVLVSPNLDTPSVLNLANATNLQLSALPQLPTLSVYANLTGSTASPTATSAMTLGNLINVEIGVDLTATTNITLSGSQTVDGVAATNGMIVLAGAQTSGVNSGFYVVNTSGAWSRWANFPSGFVVNQGCVFLVKTRLGTANGGNSFFLNTASIVTVGTSSQNWQQINEQGNSTKFGKVKVPANSATVPSLNTVGIAANFCVGFSDGVGTIGNVGNAINGDTGPCTVEDPNTGAIVLDGSPPTVSTGTIDPASVQNRGRITGLAAATSVTVTFAASFDHVPSCVASASSALAVGVSAASVSAVTFSMGALTGTLYYVCF